jgi:hypothetical protein
MEDLKTAETFQGEKRECLKYKTSSMKKKKKKKKKKKVRHMHRRI